MSGTSKGGESRATTSIILRLYVTGLLFPLGVVGLIALSYSVLGISPPKESWRFIVLGAWLIALVIVLWQSRQHRAGAPSRPFFGVIGCTIAVGAAALTLGVLASQFWDNEPRLQVRGKAPTPITAEP